MGGGRHVLIGKIITPNKGKKGGEGEMAKKGRWRRKDVRVQGKERKAKGGKECGDVSTKGLMLRNTHSPSLSPFPPSLSLHRTRGRVEQGGDGGEMTFSFVLLRAPYYHLS